MSSRQRRRRKREARAAETSVIVLFEAMYEPASFAWRRYLWLQFDQVMTIGTAACWRVLARAGYDLDLTPDAED